MNKAASTRDASGRFAKGHGGRPKGAKNKRRAYTPTEFSASVFEEATEILEGLMGKALEVIEQRLEMGDVRTAIWVLERCLPGPQNKLSETIPDVDLSSIEGIIKAAQTTTEMVFEGRLALEEASRVLTILTNTAHLLGYQRIDELRTMLEALEKQGKQGGAAGAVKLPAWGRLSEGVKQ